MRWLVIVVVAVVALLVVDVADAASVPRGGPQLAGVVAPDQTLLIPWTFGENGRAEFVADGDRLRVDALHVMTYAPTANVTGGELSLRFVWEREVPAVTESPGLTNGSTTTQEATVWVENSSREILVAASGRSVQNTEIELPERHGERLSIYYGEFRVLQVTHDTSAAFRTVPGGLAQDAWLGDLRILGAAFAVTVVGIGSSRVVHRAAGGVTPKFTGRFWSILIGLTLATASFAWSARREDVVVWGLAPLLVAYFLLVVLVGLLFWRGGAETHLFQRIAPKDGGERTVMHVWERKAPSVRLLQDHPYADRPDMILSAENTWRDFGRRLVGLRRWLQVPDSASWYYPVDGARHQDDDAIHRVYLLNGDFHEDTARHFHVDRPKGAWFPRLRVTRDVVIPVPVAPPAFDEHYMQVLVGHRKQEQTATHVHKLEMENMDLQAKRETAVTEKARTIAEKWISAWMQLGSGKNLDAAAKAHERDGRDVQDDDGESGARSSTNGDDGEDGTEIVAPPENGGRSNG